MVLILCRAIQEVLGYLAKGVNDAIGVAVGAIPGKYVGLMLLGETQVVSERLFDHL